MNDAELQRLLDDLESDRAERTVSGTDTEKFGKAVCAFANDLPNSRQPGYLFVGADPRGRASGLEITDRLLLNLASLRSEGNILPPPAINVAKRSLGGGEMVVVEVMPSDLPPVRYRGTVWVRVGPSTRSANEADERVLSERRSALARTWDAQPCPEAALDDLALQLFEGYRAAAVSKAVLDENNRSSLEQLASLRFVDRAGRPTNAAIILFGKDPLSFYPGAYVQYVAYEGETAGSDVLAERRISGDLLASLRELDGLANQIANARPEQVTGLQEVTVYDYPTAALRETFVNAVIHRDYASNTPVMINAFRDRLEIINPGGLFDMHLEDFPGPTAYRNPILAEAAATLGFVNKFGRGVPRTREAMAANSSPAPRFEPQPRHFLVVLEKRR